MLNGKRQTTILNEAALTDPGADLDFFVDGDRAEIVLHTFALAGTAPTVAIVVDELITVGLSLAYDGQTANFTVGSKLTGYNFSGGSNATGIITKDVDGGATGTLTLKNVQGKFEDNMVIVDDGGTPGKALVNSATGGTVTKIIAGQWASVPAQAADLTVIDTFINPDLAAGDGDRGKVTPREFRLSVTEGGTWTDVNYSVDVIQS